MKPPIRFTVPLAVSSLLSFACGFAQAAAIPEPHHLQPNAPRSVTVSEAQTPPVIRAGLLQSTLILLPAEEKIATVFGGDTVDWVFDAGHVASRFISIKPKLANTTTDSYVLVPNRYPRPPTARFGSAIPLHHPRCRLRMLDRWIGLCRRDLPRSYRKE